jgi:hypothetical protein
MKDGKYQYPNDETENDRLDLQHHLFSLTFDGKLFTAPIPKEKRLHRVLDTVRNEIGFTIPHFNHVKLTHFYLIH